MILQQLLTDRYIWQEKTIEAIFNKLLCKPETVLSMRRRSEKLVTVYGSPQAGKTTLILELLGISKKHRKKVYDVLRAKSPCGNSSTSTAIIYQISEREQFGYCFSDITSVSAKNAKFYSDEEFMKELQKIRQNVENGKQSTEIMYIFIPKKFADSASREHANINIIDLPGDGSRSVGENDHTQNLLKKYLAMTSVNIIVCNAHIIQSLETMKFYNNSGWRYLNSEYIVVITTAYSGGTIKDYFKTPRKQRDTTFYDYIRGHFSNELKQVFAGDCNVETFPIEIGESLGILTTEEIADSADRKEIEKTSQLVLEDIKNAIQSRNGNELKTIIGELAEFIRDYTKREIEQYRHELSEISKYQEKLDTVIKTDKIIIEKCINHSEYCGQALKKFAQFKKYLSNATICENDKNSINEAIDSCLSRGIKIKKDKAGKIEKIFYEVISDYTNKCIKDIVKTHNESNIEDEVISNCAEERVMTLNEELNEQCIEFESYGCYMDDIIHTHEFMQNLRNVFYPEKGKRVNNQRCKELLGCLLSLYENKLNEILNAKIEKHYLNLENEVQKDLNLIEILIKQKKRDIENYEERKRKSCIKSKELKRKLSEVTSVKKNDTNLLKGYLKEAKKQYLIQKSAIYDRINSKKIKPNEKMFHLIFAFLLEKDYFIIMGGNYGKAHYNTQKN